MNLKSAADRLIKPHVQSVDLRKRSYRTLDIITLVQEVLSTDADDTQAFSRQFPHSVAGLRMLFDFVDHHISYIEDPRLNQWVQTPSFLWHTKRGDCKSFTVFISSVLRNMGFRHLIRYVSYGGSNYTHVYPVAIWQGKEIPLDVVWKKQEGGPFGREKSFTKKKDFIVEGLYKLGNVASSDDMRTYMGKVESAVAEMEAYLSEVPDSIIYEGPGDVTTFTKGQLDRHIWADRYQILADQEENGRVAQQYRAAAIAMQEGDIAGIGNIKSSAFGQEVKQILAKSLRENQPAFTPLTLEFPNPFPAEVRGFFKNVGKWFKKVGDSFAKLFKKFVNWIFKGVGKAMGPYFIYLFANKNKVKTPEIRRRIQEQEKTFNWIAKVGRLNHDQLKGTVLNGIKQKTGKSPKEIFQMGEAPEIAGFLTGLVSIVIKSIGWVIKTIQKIVSLFKKSKTEAGVVNESNASDPTLLEEEARRQKEAGGSTEDLSKEGGFGLATLLPVGILALLRAA